MKQLLLPFLLAPLACSSAPLTPKMQAAIAVAECELEAVKAVVPHAETAEAVVAAARAGDVDRAVALLVALGMQEPEIKAVAEAFHSCVPKTPPPAPGPLEAN